jgi:mRNA-degrading endonuclease toxin of MazEF toxin-antitoxin module
MQQGDVWLANVYFRDSREYKQRPVVIVGNELAIDIDVLITPVTSQHSRGPFDVVLIFLLISIYSMAPKIKVFFICAPALK